MFPGTYWRRLRPALGMVVAILATLLYVTEWINGRFWLHDLQVYHGSARMLLEGGDVYGVAHGLGTGIFKYSPFMAMLFVPYALLPFTLAATLHYALITAAFIGSVIVTDSLLRQVVMEHARVRIALLFIATVISVVHLHRELHLGNINMILLWILLVAAGALLKRRNVTAGLFIGLVIIAKPHFVILLPLLVLRRLWPVLMATIGTIFICIILPALLIGWTGALELHRQWLEHMAMHNASLIYSGGDDHRAVNTIHTFVHRLVIAPFTMQVPGALPVVIVGVVALLFGIFALRNMRKEEVQEGGMSLEFLILIALVPSLTITDTEHFIFSLPLVIYILHHLFLDRSQHRWLLPVAILLFFMYGGNWEDALGPMSGLMINYGVLGMANIGIILLSVFLFLKPRSNFSPVPASTIKAPG